MAARVVAAVVGGFVVLVGLLVVAEAVPDDVVVGRLTTAIDQDQYGPVLAPDALGGLHDGFTECVALGLGLGTPPEPMGLVARTIWAPRIGACEEGAGQIFTLADGGQVEAGPYFRYWNGYAPLTRPVVALVGIRGLRVTVGALLLAAAAFATVAVGRRLGWLVTAALAAPLLVASNAVVTPAGSFTHAISLAAVAVGTGVVAIATERAGWRGAAAGAAAGAALFVYVDLLTTPAIPWALAAFVAAGVVAVRGAAPTAVAASGLAAGLAWPLAWGVTWAARWLLAATVHGREVLTTIAEVSRFRVSGAFAGVEDQVGAATRANLHWWWDRTVTAPAVLVVAVLVCLATLAVAVRRGRRSGPAVGARLELVALLAAPALLVPAWYELLSNHSQIHAFFTYRGVPVAVGIGTAACILVATRRPVVTAPPGLRPSTTD